MFIFLVVVFYVLPMVINTTVFRVLWEKDSREGIIKVETLEDLMLVIFMWILAILFVSVPLFNLVVMVALFIEVREQYGYLKLTEFWKLIKNPKKYFEEKDNANV